MVVPVPPLIVSVCSCEDPVLVIAPLEIVPAKVAFCEELIVNASEPLASLLQLRQSQRAPGIKRAMYIICCFSFTYFF